MYYLLISIKKLQFNISNVSVTKQFYKKTSIFKVTIAIHNNKKQKQEAHNVNIDKGDLEWKVRAVNRRLGTWNEDGGMRIEV